MNRLHFVACLAIFSSLALHAAPPPRFPPGSVWHQNIANAPTHPESELMISTLDGLGGFGLGRMQIDFGLHVVRAGPAAPLRTIERHSTFDSYFLPDCEPLGTMLPVPLNAAIEAQPTQGDLDCDNAGEDCHLLVVQGHRLYEAFASTTSQSGNLEAQCLAIWELNVEYPPEGRGEHCTSADAAGFPIAPLLFNADEIAASLAADPSGNGDLGHAIRFILPNDRMASDESLGGVAGRLYVRPASHAGAPSGPVNSVPYGARLRLRSDFPLDQYHPAARVILNTFMRYGMVLADGGRVALTAESDLYTDAKWDDPNIDIGSRVFFDQISGATPVQITDFEVLDTGPRIGETFECVRTVIPTDTIFGNGYEGSLPPNLG